MSYWVFSDDQLRHALAEFTAKNPASALETAATINQFLRSPEAQRHKLINTDTPAEVKPCSQK